MDQDGNLIVVDSYLGLHKVNPRTGEKTLLLSSENGDATFSREVDWSWVWSSCLWINWKIKVL